MENHCPPPLTISALGPQTLCPEKKGGGERREGEGRRGKGEEQGRGGEKKGEGGGRGKECRVRGINGWGRNVWGWETKSMDLSISGVVKVSTFPFLGANENLIWG